MKTWELVLAVVFLYSSRCYAYFKLAGPYEIIVEDFQDCEDVGTHQIQHNLNMKKLNATTKVLQGNVTYLVDFSVSYKTSAAMWTSGGWGQNAFSYEGKELCSEWRDNMWEIFEAFCSALGVPVQCPIPPGTYSTPIGMPLVFRKLKRFPALPYGRYKAHSALYKGDTRVGCVVLKIAIDEIASTSILG